MEHASSVHSSLYRMVNVGARTRSWAWLQIACAFSHAAGNGQRSVLRGACSLGACRSSASETVTCSTSEVPCCPASQRGWGRRKDTRWFWRTPSCFPREEGRYASWDSLWEVQMTRELQLAPIWFVCGSFR